MSAQTELPEPELKRQAKDLVTPAVGFLMIGLTVLVPGLLLVLLGHGWVFTLGIVLMAISSPFDIVGVAGLGSAVVAHWAARRKSFA
jgi:hypothetical protein